MGSASAIVMPKLGLTMTEGLLASWRVQPGDTVKAGDVLFVVETEKIATEIEAPAEGRIESIAVPEGRTVPVGTVVATWTGPAAHVEAAAAAYAAPASETAAPIDTPRPDGDARPARIVATPLARRRAADAGIDLATIRGSGPRGRIKAADVEAALAQARHASPPEPARAPPSAAPELPASPAASASQTASVSRRPASQIETIVARRLTASKQTIPHFYILADADVTELLRIREQLNSVEGAPRVSINHLIVAAVGKALARLPDMNSLWDDGEIVTLAGTDVGIAVDTPRGLLVPVLRNAGGISLDALTAAASDLVTRAREGRLQQEDLEGGSISVSNVGMFGASYLVPIINPGQSAILGVGALKSVFRPDAAGAPVLRQEVGLVLSCDHRVFDGVRAARFLDRVAHLLQHPLQLLRA
jgi:pyruvate dehydrogenase E2 component (dihydrolipoamide acetyltransferase)